jgi:hypothetical protein
MSLLFLNSFTSFFAALLAGFQAAGPTFEVFQTSKVLVIGKET